MRKILIGLIILCLFAIIGIGGYAYMSNLDISTSETDSSASEQSSDSSEPKSEIKSDAPTIKSDVDAVDLDTDPVVSDTEQPASETTSDSDLDENGVPREQSKYLDEDGDTVANYYDICPGYDDFNDENGNDVPDDCEDPTTEDGTATGTGGSLSPDTNEEGSDLDKNGDSRDQSKYLDEDGDTVANYFDLCPGVDDFSADCEDNTSTDTAADDTAAESKTAEVDENGDSRDQSKYLDDDGDTVANFYDICPNGDDVKDEDKDGTPDDCQ